jgi:hypothetical protein
MGKYRLTFYTPHHPTKAPFERGSDYLAEVLAVAWRNRYHGGRNERVAGNGGAALFDELEIERLCRRMDELEVCGRVNAAELVDRARLVLKERWLPRGAAS